MFPALRETVKNFQLFLQLVAIIYYYKPCRIFLIRIRIIPGAMFAAEQGESCIPTEWTQQTLLHSQIVTMADR